MNAYNFFKAHPNAANFATISKTLSGNNFVGQVVVSGTWRYFGILTVMSPQICNFCVSIAKINLQALAICIFEVCMSFDIAIEMEWLPRSQNERADFLSRIVDLDDWSVIPELFRLVDYRWGPHNVDHFSSFYNAQIGRFNSRFWNPGSEAFDAFIQDWSLDNNWLCPPISLVVHAVRHLIACKGTGTLIIPEWPSSYFWPFVNPTNGSVKRIV